MSSILKAKNWQVFLLIMAPLILLELTAEHAYKAYILAVWISLFFGWLLMLNQSLSSHFSNKVKLSSSLFIINIFLLTIALCGMNLFLEPGSNLVLEGAWALLGFYYIFAFIQVFYSTAKRLVSVEKGKEAEAGECIGDTLLLLFFPLGIWFLQPRINAIFAKRNNLQ